MAKRDEGAGEGGGRLRAFAGNSYDDYYDSAFADFPLPGRLLAGLVVAVVNAFTKVVYPWRVEDEGLLAPDGRGRVVIMNHESMIDPVVLYIRLRRMGVGVRPIYKSEFDDVGIVTWLFSRIGGIPVGRGTADMKSIRRARAALQRGEYVIVFPEGTRIKHDAEAEVHGGYALMAQLARCPVQPCAIIGARNLRFRTRPYIRVGEPIGWEGIHGKRREQLEEMERLGMERVYALRDALRAEHPEIEED